MVLLLVVGQHLDIVGRDLTPAVGELKSMAQQRGLRRRKGDISGPVSSSFRVAGVSNAAKSARDIE
jgi:hypothetical protein